MVILTDLSEVLIKGVSDVGWKLVKKYDASVGVKYNDRFVQTISYFDDLLRGHITEDQYIDILLGKEKWPFSKDELKVIISEEFKERIPYTYDVYNRISAHPITASSRIMIDGMPSIYIVSDHIKEHTDAIMNYHCDIFEMVRGQIWSCDIGRIKRDPGFFHDLLNMLRLAPEEAVFIDDSIENTKAAIKAGITSIQFINAYQLEERLTQLGFEFIA